MSKCNDISLAVQKGKKNDAVTFVQEALSEGIKAEQILTEGLLPAMDIVGQKFTANEIYVPEMLIAARAMNAAMEILKPMLVDAGVKPIGRAVIGTVKGDLHDIGKNLVRLMLEGKGIEVFDLGVDVSAEQFADAAAEHDATIVACSALLTTTMTEMKRVVEVFVERGLRDKVKIMVGGAPITEAFCKEIGADYYTADAASAGDVARNILVSA
ncbi:MAG: corrinoid protein [Defluviitaleaceae bacterium]|nr:corrinoid protein [Defluviitaleaceae bacterium]